MKEYCWDEGTGEVSQVKVKAERGVKPVLLVFLLSQLDLYSITNGEETERSVVRI